MQILVRAIVTGFGLSIGAALYKKLAKEMHWNEQDAKDIANAAPTSPSRDGGATPHPMHS